MNKSRIKKVKEMRCDWTENGKKNANIAIVPKKKKRNEKNLIQFSNLFLLTTLLWSGKMRIRSH